MNLKISLHYPGNTSMINMDSSSCSDSNSSLNNRFSEGDSLIVANIRNIRFASCAAALTIMLLALSSLVAQTNSSVAAEGRQSVLAKGAKANGVENDTPAINAAFAALPSSGGTIVFPPGTYLISSTISIPTRVKLICDGATGLTGSMHGSCRLLKSAKVKGPALYFGPPSRGSIVEGLEIDGQKGNSGDGIQILTNSIALRDVAVVNQGGIGIHIGEDSIRDGSQANSFYLERVRAANNDGDGFYIHKEDVTGPGWPDANAGVMINCVAQNNRGDGLRIGKGIDNTIIGFLAEGNKGAGVHLISGASNQVFVGGDLNEANVAGNAVMDPGNIQSSYFFGTNTGKSVRDNGTVKSVFWNRTLGLTGGSVIPGISNNLALGASSIQSGAGAPNGACQTGSMYLRTDGGHSSTLYICEAGRWAGK